MAAEHNDAVPGLIGECNRSVWRIFFILPILLVEYQLPEIGQFLRMFFSFLFQFFDVLLALLDLTGCCMRCLAESVIFLLQSRILCFELLYRIRQVAGHIGFLLLIRCISIRLPIYFFHQVIERELIEHPVPAPALYLTQDHHG